MIEFFQLKGSDKSRVKQKILSESMLGKATAEKIEKSTKTPVAKKPASIDTEIIFDSVKKAFESQEMLSYLAKLHTLAKERAYDDILKEVKQIKVGATKISMAELKKLMSEVVPSASPSVDFASLPEGCLTATYSVVKDSQEYRITVEKIT